MTEFKKGDRVRITDVREGEVTRVSDDYVWIRESDGGHTGFDINGGPVLMSRTVEKLAHPEPEWVNGDVVRVTALPPQNPYATLVRHESGWRGVGPGWTDSGTVARHWRDGNLEILFKADQQKKVA